MATAVDDVFTSTSVTRDGFGVGRDRQSLRSHQRIIVAGIFEAFARPMTPDARPVQIPGSVAALATVRLVPQAGCNGPEFRCLMRNMARVAGAADAFDQAFPAPTEGAGCDWLGFVAACVPSVKREARRVGENWSHSGAVGPGADAALPRAERGNLHRVGRIEMRDDDAAGGGRDQRGGVRGVGASAFAVSGVIRPAPRTRSCGRGSP